MFMFFVASMVPVRLQLMYPTALPLESDLIVYQLSERSNTNENEKKSHCAGQCRDCCRLFSNLIPLQAGSWCAVGHVIFEMSFLYMCVLA